MLVEVLDTQTSQARTIERMSQLVTEIHARLISNDGGDSQYSLIVILRRVAPMLQILQRCILVLA